MLSQLEQDYTNFISWCKAGPPVKYLFLVLTLIGAGTLLYHALSH